MSVGHRKKSKTGRKKTNNHDREQYGACVGKLYHSRADVCVCVCMSCVREQAWHLAVGLTANRRICNMFSRGLK